MSYQTTISQHDLTQCLVYYTDKAQYTRYHDTVEKAVFKKQPLVDRITHMIDGDVIAYKEREQS